MKNKPLKLLILILCAMVYATQMANAQSAPEVAGDAQLPNTFLNTVYTANTGGTTYSPSDSSAFQTALNSAQFGDTIVLQAGTIYRGNFLLPKKTGTGWIIIRTSDLSGISATEVRINPATHAAAMPKIETTIDSPVIRTDAGANHYRLIGLEIRLATDGVTRLTNSLVTLGNGDETDANLPSDIIVDRCYVHGLDNAELKRGVQLNGKSSAVIDSYVSKINGVTIESQAVSGWNGPGPFKVVNNYLEGSGENLFFGGSEIVTNRVPADIEIKRNHLFKPPAWRHNKLVKNLFELKNARRVVVESNLMENDWAWEQGDPCGNGVCDASGKGQVGLAVLFTPRNESSNNATWTVVEDVTFRNNIVRHAAGAIRIHAYSENTVQQTKRITITNNLFDDINASKWGPSNGINESGIGTFRGELFFIVGKNGGDLDSGPKDIHIRHNTGFVNGNLANVIWGMDACNGTQKAQGFIFTQNIVQHNSNNESSQAGGIAGGCRGTGNSSLSTFYPSVSFKENVLMGGDVNLYSGFNNPANFFPADWATVRFVNMAAGDYRLASNSPYKNAGSDGKDLGLSDATLLPTASAPPIATLPLRINAGGPQYVDGSANVWQADDYHLAGFPASTTQNIANTTDDALYRSERFGGNSAVNPLAYAIRVPNGSYTVRLHFAETYWCAPGNPCPNNGQGAGIGARVFSVKLEGAQALGNYDIIAEAGGALTAQVETAQTNVTDGILNIDFTTITDNAKISAIEVIPPADTGFWANVVGVTPNGNSITKLTPGTPGWSAGATSAQSISGNGYVEFSTGETTTNKMAGLNSDHMGQNYSEIDYAINLSPSGNVRIYENSAPITNPATGTVFFGTYVAGDVFRVAVESGVVKYYQNGTFLYMSEHSPASQLVLDTSLNTAGATIINAKIAD
ncbi:MAG: malectin [Pyrinomonadaceae bacterium]